MSEGNGKKRVIKVSISIPNEGHTQPAAYDNRLEFAIHLGMLQAMSHFGHHDYQGVHYEFPDDVEYEFYWSTIGRVLTPLARERLTDWALQAGMDYMLMIDDDMIIPRNMFEKLIRHNVDVVAPLAFMRQPPHKPVIYRVTEGYDKVRCMEYYVTQIVTNYPKDTLVECDAVGFGSALIKMDAVKKMQKPYFMSTTQSGEDLWFCKCAREAGARIYMDTSVKLGHLGDSPVITEETFEKEFNSEEMRKLHGDWKGKQREIIYEKN